VHKPAGNKPRKLGRHNSLVTKWPTNNSLHQKKPVTVAHESKKSQQQTKPTEG